MSLSEAPLAFDVASSCEPLFELPLWKPLPQPLLDAPALDAPIVEALPARALLALDDFGALEVPEVALAAASFDVLLQELVYLFHFQDPSDGLEEPLPKLAYLFQRHGVSSSFAAEPEDEELEALLPAEPLLPIELLAAFLSAESTRENLPLVDLLSDGLTKPALTGSPVEPLPELSYLFHFQEPLLDAPDEPLPEPYLFQRQEPSSLLDSEPPFDGVALQEEAPAGLGVLGGGGTGGFGMPAPL